MKISQLMNKLSKMPQDAEVCVRATGPEAFENSDQILFLIDVEKKASLYHDPSGTFMDADDEEADDCIPTVVINAETVC